MKNIYFKGTAVYLVAIWAFVVFLSAADRELPPARFPLDEF